MIVKKNEADEEEISGEGKVLDYDISENIGIAKQELDGRVPKKGWYRNKECHEICYVISGSAEISIEDQNYEVSEGDVFIIEPGDKSFVQADKLEMLVITRPDWYEAQCEIIRE